MAGIGDVGQDSGLCAAFVEMDTARRSWTVESVDMATERNMNQQVSAIHFARQVEVVVGHLVDLDSSLDMQSVR